MNYKKEIDGLRAIAVLSVIIYHLDIFIFGHKVFRGGFLGVDIFFVISGYLITSIIIKDQSNNNFSIFNFYFRRAKRILPAYFFMTLITLIFSIFIVSQSDLKEIIYSMFSSTFFVSNFFFYFSSLEYGGLNGLLKPYLHTWTLSVEQQFYLFFPIIFIFFNPKKRNIFIYLIFFISFCFSNLAFKYYPNLNFYLIFSRAWELFFGYIIYTNQNNIEKFFYKKKSKEVVSIISFFLIIFSLIIFYDEKLHPSIFTLLIIIPTGILIIFARENKIIQFLLSNKLAISIGIISYSLYLWHYPILALFRYKLIEFSFNYKLLALAIISFFSILSYQVIEKKFRNKKTKILKLSSFIISVFLVNILIIVSFYNFFNKKYFNEKIILDNSYLTKLRKTNYKRGWDYFNQFRNDKNEDIIVIGDSHRFDFHQILNASTIRNNFNIFQCTVRLIYFEENKNKKDYKIAREKNWIGKTEKCLKKITKKKYKKIIISYSFRDKDLDYLNSLLSFLNDLGYAKDIILTSRFLSFEFDQKGKTYLDSVLTNKEIEFDKIRDEKVMFKKININDYKINKKLKSLSKFYETEFFDKTSLQCNFFKKSCHIITNLNEKIYIDASPHLTLEGAKFFAIDVSNKFVLK